jgi:thiamine biosynthesis protein ThiS
MPEGSANGTSDLLIVVRLNGEERTVPKDLTLARLIEWLELPADRVAVERNLELVPRRQWPVTPVLPGDRLEVVHFVGGGAGPEEVRPARPRP